MKDAEVVYEGKYLRTVRKGHWEYVERTTSSGAVVIIAVTRDFQIVLVEQNRIPVDGKVIELPAGLCDVPEENKEETARRELLEETGYEAGTIKLLCHGPISPGLSNEKIWVFLATDLRKQNNGGGVSDEDITVHTVYVSHLYSFLEQKQEEGFMIDPKVLMSMPWAEKICLTMEN